MTMKIFEPFEINSMTLKNRIGFPPFGNMPTGKHGCISEQTIRWYEQRAKGGAGLILTGPLRVSTPKKSGNKPKARVMKGFGIDDDKYIPGFTRLADIIHSYGAKIGAYIGSGGPVTGQGPSCPPYPDNSCPKDDFFYFTMGKKPYCRELSIKEIRQIQDNIAAAAKRAKSAGIDFVNIPCAHGSISLHGSFLSPFYNRRTDRYGGSWENRIRIIMETIKKVRKSVGKNYPVFVRISADEFLGTRGITLEDTINTIVPALEDIGVDCIDLSYGTPHTMEGLLIPTHYPLGCFIDMVAAVKKVTNLPVIAVGNIIDLDMAERFLKEKKADLIYMGRQLTSDPETPKKYLEKRVEDIRQCIGCLSLCGTPCTINYDMQSNPIPLIPTKKQKNILVIGSGVAGMESARIAAVRGHKVTLIEKDPELGGSVAALCLASWTARFRNIVDFLSNQMKKLNVDVRLSTVATKDVIRDLNPDVVILATGSSMVMPEITKGKNGVKNHIEALKQKSKIGNKIVIWGLNAAELALSLAKEDRDVVIIGEDGQEALARDALSTRRFSILRKLTDVNVVRATPDAKRVKNPEVIYNIEVQKIDAKYVKIYDKDSRTRMLPYDTLIVSGKRVSNDALVDQLDNNKVQVENNIAQVENNNPRIYKVGDCAKIGDIRQAIWSANKIARRI